MPFNSLEKGLNLNRNADDLAQQHLVLQEELRNIPGVEEKLKEIERVQSELKSIEKDNPARFERICKFVMESTENMTLVVAGVVIPLVSLARNYNLNIKAAKVNLLGDEAFVIYETALYANAVAAVLSIIILEAKKVISSAEHR